MDYQPLPAPPSDHHQLNTGLSTELGASAKQLIEHINANFLHVFQVLKGDVAHAVEVVDDDARKAVTDLGEHVASLEHKLDELLAVFRQVAATPAGITDPSHGAPANPNVPVAGAGAPGLAAALAQAGVAS